jgi:hypothetical protein
LRAVVIALVVTPEDSHWRMKRWSQHQRQDDAAWISTKDRAAYGRAEASGSWIGDSDRVLASMRNSAAPVSPVERREAGC